MKQVHIRGVSEDGLMLLPFAKKQLARLAKATQGRPSERTLLVGDFTVRLRVFDADSGDVKIEGAPPSYQFFTTGPEIRTRPIGGSPNPGVLGHAVRVRYDRKHDKLVGVPLGSSLELSASSPPKWPYFADPIGVNRVLKRVWQIEGIPEHTNYSPEGETVVSCWTGSTDMPGAGIRGGIGRANDPIDVEYDVAPTRFKTPGPAQHPPLVPDADWYRRAMLRTVKHPLFGSRTFCILTDVSNNFIVFPYSVARDYPQLDPFFVQQSIKTTLGDERVVKRIAPVLPSWARQHTGLARNESLADSYTKTLLNHPQTVWKFNSTATRCAALLEYEFPPVPFPSTAFTKYPSTLITHPYAGQPPTGADVDVEYVVRESLPGLVELAIDITLIGPKAADFEAALSTVTEIDPRSTPYYLIGVDYAWDIGVLARQRKDDLMVMYGEVWHSCTSWATRYSDYSVQFKIKNLTLDLIVDNIRGEGIVITGTRYASPNEAGGNLAHDALRLNIAALDLRIAGLVLERRLIRKRPGDGITIESVEESAVKLEVYAWGQLQEQRFLTGSTALGAQLDSYNAADPTGPLTLFSPLTFGQSWATPIIGSPFFLTDGPYFKYHLVLDQFFAEYRLYFENQLHVNPETTPEFINGVYQLQTGAAMYRFLVYAALTPTAHSRFAAHPAGHWSITSNRCVFYGGASKVPFTEYADWISNNTHAVIGGGNAFTSIFDIANFVQDFVDIVSVRVYDRHPDGSVTHHDVKGTHLALANEAFSKTWTKTDFLCDITQEATSYEEGPGYPQTDHRVIIADKFDPSKKVRLFMAIIGPSPDVGFDYPNARYRGYRSPQYLETARSMKILSNQNFEFDLQMLYGVTDWHYYIRQLTPIGVDVSGEGIVNVGPVLNGSALFLGSIAGQPPKAA